MDLEHIFMLLEKTGFREKDTDANCLQSPLSFSLHLHFFYLFEQSKSTIIIDNSVNLMAHIAVTVRSNNYSQSRFETEIE